MHRTELRRHMTQTYLNLRVGTAVMGLALPLILWIGGLVISGVELQGSMSAYYYTPLRDSFVGILFAVGACLYLYKGFSHAENYALNCAGAVSIIAALFPVAPPANARVVVDISTGTAIAPYTPCIHNVSAVVFFLIITYVCIFRSKDSLRLINDPDRVRRFQRIYRVVGALMVLFPLLSVFLAYFGQRVPLGEKPVVTFFVELAAMWVFSVYWLVKTWELSRHTGCVEEELLKDA